MVVEEIVNDRHYHVDAMDHSDVEEEQDQDQDDSLDYSATVVLDYLVVVKVFVVDNSVVVVAAVAVDVRNHDPRTEATMIHLNRQSFHQNVTEQKHENKTKVKSLEIIVLPQKKHRHHSVPA